MFDSVARRARVGVFGYFGLCGLNVGIWAASLPALADRLDLSPGRTGTALLLVSLSALVSMQAAGRLADRWSSRRLTWVAGPLHALLLLGPALAGSYSALLAGAVVFGLGFGLLEVGMNAHAVEVEVRYGRPIMSAFHGMWSLGGAVGGVVTSAGLGGGLGVQTLLVGTAFTMAALFLLPARLLLPGSPARDAADASPAASAEADASAAARTGRGRVPAVILLLGVVMLAGAICEGGAMDWAAMHARRVLGASADLAPLSFTVYSVAMTTMRLLGDRLRGRLGAGRTLRLAGAVAAGGYALVLLAPSAGGAALGCAWAGWILVGIGLATVVPVGFSSAGADPASAGRTIALLTSFTYGGLLAGPAIIGHLAEATSLRTALALPGVLAVFVALAGPPAIAVLAARRTPAPDSAAPARAS
ncbi:MFS transporter [Actinoallomurus rhizosphaericola]|uniref:MFS transporter n=1 Tax=Actinoallomurus rhizosphaericola TaxID=2952536 RepID=UPI0020928F4B|nr:MFS transporter [Actinoallomurus rhizosphaericola]MCO5997792.1 MFS transporter [Actinoallomurus rhizosphaericola]